MNISVHQLLDKKGNEILSVLPECTVFDAIKKMSEFGVGALVVIKNEKLLGIISERDYTRKVILKDRSSKTTTVEEIMTSKVICVTPDTSIDECMALMFDNHLRHLPVVENDRVTGVISVMDVLKSILTEKEFIIEQLEHYIAGTA